MGKSFDPIGLAGGMRDAELLNSTPRPIVSMSFQLAIPWRVALPQSPPPLHQPGTIMQQRAAAGHQKPANGQQCLNYLSHPRGQAHYAAQCGETYPSAKALKGFPGASVLEIVVPFDTDTYRAVYTVQFRSTIYVLHAFQKKAKQGKKTPRKDIDLIKRRLEAARQDHNRRQN